MPHLTNFSSKKRLPERQDKDYMGLASKLRYNDRSLPLIVQFLHNKVQEDSEFSHWNSILLGLCYNKILPYCNSHLLDTYGLELLV